MGDHDEDDQPTNSSDQELDQDDQVGIVRGGRSYECIFCKRGFTTAQALGGHMNIHRKDRAKNRPSYLSNNNKSSNKQDDDDHGHGCYTNPRFFQPIFASYPPTYNLSTPPTNHHHQEGGHVHYFSSTSGERIMNYYENNHQDHQWGTRDHDQVITSTSREQFGWSNGEDEDLRRRSIRGGGKEDELDLELRLGHDP
ncbi:hypothetical protein L6452_38135 [Arctium lappa]|uniref:Uncharacterized protein n=1 Tax=Arctium lappa TaxID=4217 RepID=A0ACB8Y5P2_ARCLA|nr:hypothetical protein L6452_38135 [Arctium lappa]